MTLSQYIRYFYRSKTSEIFSSITLLITSLLLIGGGLFSATRLDFAVFPPAKDSTEVNIEITTDPGTNINQAKNIAIQTEEIIFNEMDYWIYLVDFAEYNFISELLNLNSSMI